MRFICMRSNTHFHIKGWAFNLVLIQRLSFHLKIPWWKISLPCYILQLLGSHPPLAFLKRHPFRQNLPVQVIIGSTKRVACVGGVGKRRGGGSSRVKEGEESFPFPSSSQGHCASNAHEIRSFLPCVADPWKKWVQEKTACARETCVSLSRAPFFLSPVTSKRRLRRLPLPLSH